MSGGETNQAPKDEKPWQWKPGQSGNPAGRPPRAREAAYLAIIREEAGLAQWRDIVRAQVDAAKGGDLDAAKWIADYAIGKPKQAISIEHAEADPAGEWDDFTDEELRAIASGADAAAGTARAGAASDARPA